MTRVRSERFKDRGAGGPPVKRDPYEELSEVMCAAGVFGFTLSLESASDAIVREVGTIVTPPLGHARRPFVIVRYPDGRRELQDLHPETPDLMDIIRERERARRTDLRPEDRLRNLRYRKFAEWRVTR